MWWKPGLLINLAFHGVFYWVQTRVFAVTTRRCDLATYRRHTLYSTHIEDSNLYVRIVNCENITSYLKSKMTLMATKGTIKLWSIIENCCANLFYFLSYWPMSHSLFHNHFIQTVKWNDQTFIYQSKSKGAQSKQCPWQIYSSLKSATYFQILIISLIILSKCSFKHPKQIRTKRK